MSLVYAIYVRSSFAIKVVFVFAVFVIQKKYRDMTAKEMLRFTLVLVNESKYENSYTDLFML